MLPKEYSIAIVGYIVARCKKCLRSNQNVARKLGCHSLASRPNFLRTSCGPVKNWTLSLIKRTPVDIQQSVIVVLLVAKPVMM